MPPDKYQRSIILYNLFFLSEYQQLTQYIIADNNQYCGYNRGYVYIDTKPAEYLTHHDFQYIGGNTGYHKLTAFSEYI